VEARAGARRAPPDLIRPVLVACVLHTGAMDVTDDVVRLLLEHSCHIEPQAETHVHKILLWDITRGHPQRLPPPSVAIRPKTRTT
jgi:hypothetical protein